MKILRSSDPMKLFFTSSKFYFMLIAVLLAGCANQQMPQGGPVDTKTPEIIYIYPDSNARNYRDNKIRIVFDRYVEERSVEESIFISPYIGSLEFDWSGNEVEISFSEKLKENTTYVVNIGTDVKDRYRNQMRMAQAYTLAFSTGPDIDNGGIEGRVFPVKIDDAVDGIMIFAYRMNQFDPAKLNPITEKPDFITQTGKNGDYFLHHIPFGSYRIFAVKDEYRNLIYDRETDEYGVPSGFIDITPGDTLVTGVFMKLAKEDTTGPRLVKVTAKDKYHLIAEFSETINPSSSLLASFSAVDTSDKKLLKLLTIYPSSTAKTSFIAITQEQDSSRAYDFSAQDVADSAGNKINPHANSFVFQGSQQTDTLDIRLISVSIIDSVQNVELRPVLTMIFSDALVKTGSLDLVQLLDNKNRIIPVEKKWISDEKISLQPVKELESKTWYVLSAELNKMIDWNGKPCRDSVKILRFETLDAEDFSSIEGRVNDTNAADSSGRIYVSAIKSGTRFPKQYTVLADVTGNFFFPQVEEGNYVFQAFRDRNNNGNYDYGMPFPFAFSERISALSDTLKVRARWPLEGVNVFMK